MVTKDDCRPRKSKDNYEVLYHCKWSHLSLLMTVMVDCKYFSHLQLLSLWPRIWTKTFLFFELHSPYLLFFKSLWWVFFPCYFSSDGANLQFCYQVLRNFLRIFLSYLWIFWLRWFWRWLCLKVIISNLFCHQHPRRLNYLCSYQLLQTDGSV